jgi:tRNA dimethylallyltransferase
MDAVQVRTELVRLDPAMAAQLKVGDSQRNLRALEVIMATGTSLAVWQAKSTQPAFPIAQYHGFVAMHPRAEMYARIDRRFEVMMREGALDEVRQLVALNLNPALPILRAHGVPELMAHLRGDLTLPAAITKAQQHTRNYAKRQMTWLRNQWPDAAVVSDVAQIIVHLN